LKNRIAIVNLFVLNMNLENKTKTSHGGYPVQKGLLQSSVNVLLVNREAHLNCDHLVDIGLVISFYMQSCRNAPLC